MIHCFFLDIYEHILSHFAHSRLSITHSGRRIPIYRTEVTLSIYEHIAHIPPLCHAYHGIIYRRIPMWVVLTEYFPDDTSGFFMCGIATYTEFMHSKEYTPMYRLESIAYIRQGPGDNYRH